MDIYEDDDFLSEAELDNFHNLRHELQKQLDAVVEENVHLREDNQKLIESLDELRQRKIDLLEIYNENIRLAEQLAGEIRDKQRAHNDDISAGSGPGAAGKDEEDKNPRKRAWKYLPSWASVRPSYYTYNSSSLLSNSYYNSPGPGSSSAYKRALDYARYSHPRSSLSSYSRASRNFDIWNRHYF